jgi:putative membrane protein
MSLSESLPHLNAILNAIAACCLTAGYYFVRRRELDRHRACMISAAIVSGLFLISYIAHRFNAPIFEFRGQGWIRPVYYTLLISHVTLSIAIVPLVALTLWRAIKGRFEMHRKVARWAWPAWMYVSITGIIVYLMLYQVYPA